MILQKLREETPEGMRCSGVTKVGNGWAQAQPIMFGAKPILMFTISFHTYTHAFSDKKIHYNALCSYHIATYITH